jgi:beta-lactamase superfamily II metal-dependent hydrolase
MDRPALSRSPKAAARSRGEQRTGSRDQPVASVHPLLTLQRSIGNQAVQRLMRASSAQAKLKISQPGDKFGRQADHVASAVMKSPMPATEREIVSRAVDGGRAGGGATQGEDRSAKKASAQPTVQRSSRSTLRQHPQPDEEFEESGSPLRQHPQLNGEHIQRPASGSTIQPRLKISQPGDESEKEADRVGESVMRMPEPAVTDKGIKNPPTKSIASQITPMVATKRLGPEETKASSEPVVQRRCEQCQNELEDSKARPMHAGDSDSNPASGLPVQRLCPECEQRSKQTQTAASGSTVSRKEADGSSPQVSPSAASNISAMEGGGSPLPLATRGFFESRFGTDLSPVRVHTDGRAADTARSINAKAFTVGRNIAFGTGQYAPESREGRQVLAHELTHVVQQNGSQLQRAQPRATGQAPAVATSVKPEAEKKGEVKRKPDAGAGNAPANAGGADAGQAGQQVALDQASKDSLAKSGLVVSAADQSELAQGFPGGFSVGLPTPVVLSLDFGNRLDGVRAQVFRLTPARTPQPGVEAWFFQIGKGRSILLSSIGGGSVLLDAGTGQTTSINARSVQRLSAAVGAVTSGTAAVPQMIKFSHDDADHYNAVRAILTRAEFARTAVEVTRQQIEGSGPWSRTSLTVQPTQRLIEIDVARATGGVHIKRTVIDNMELTEFRSVAAHSDLGRTDKVTFNRNRTSPVVVVRDLNTGNRMLFTGDAEGRQFDEIVNAIGDTGMRRLLGAEGRNLKVMEAPHHFGEQAGPNARGMINMLQLAYESGEGSLRLVAQTTQNFATKASSTYNFLDASGTAPERIEGDPSGAGRAQATRTRGSTMARVTVDLAGVQQAIHELQARDTPLRQAYARLAELDVTQARLAAIRSGLGGTAAAPITSSLTTSEADIVRMRTELRAATQAVWDAMRAAAAPEGMRNTVDMTAVNAALGQLAPRVTATDADATRVGNGITALAEGMSTYARLSTNSVRIIQALESGNVQELFAARAEHNDVVRAARAELGGKVVDENIRSAWKAVQAQWPVEEFEARTAEMSAQVATRERSAEFALVLSQGLRRQMELNKIVAEAEHAGRQVYGPGGTVVTPRSTRVGAGVMAAIEVVRIGLDIAVQWKQGSEAADLRAAHTAYQGIAIMNWWQRLGVTPTLALAKAGIWNQSKLSIVLQGPQGKVREAATSDSPPKDIPEFTAVVVTGLDSDGLRKLIHRAIAELSTLEEWNTFSSGFPGGDAFKAFDGFVWGVRVFLEDEGKYGYVPVEEIAPGLNLEMIRLYGELVKAQENAFEADQKAGKARYGVKDTAWIFGQDRRVVIYTHTGNPKVIDFDSDRPRFQKMATVAYPWRVEGPMVKVKAADMMTYNTLVDYFWIEGTGEMYADSSGQHERANFGRNVHGYAYVDPDNLIQRDG